MRSVWIAVFAALSLVSTSVHAMRLGQEPHNPQQMEKHRRMKFVLGLSEALDLSEAEALKLAEKARGFEEKRRPLREAMQEATSTLRDAANGKTEAYGKVDAATQKLLDVRQQMAALDKELFSALAANLSAQKKAKLVLFLGRMRGEGRGPHEPQRMPRRGFHRGVRP